MVKGRTSGQNPCAFVLRFLGILSQSGFLRVSSTLLARSAKGQVFLKAVIVSPLVARMFGSPFQETVSSP
ncbi:MAG: hypothetical protein NZ959_03225 [Armatimonadetes bacterium]|nr:hypothetical protein [Armatimonadota bacterium]